MIQPGICLDRVAKAFIKTAYLARENSCCSACSLLLSSGRLLSFATSFERTVSDLPGNSGVGSALSNKEKVHMPYELQLLMQQNNAKTVRQKTYQVAVICSSFSLPCICSWGSDSCSAATSRQTREAKGKPGLVELSRNKSG